MKHTKNSKELTNLINAFRNAEDRVNKIFEHSATGAQFKTKIDKQTKINEMALLQKTSEWAKKELPEAFEKGYNSVRIDATATQKTFYDLTKSVLPFVEIGGKVHESIGQYREQINSAINQVQKNQYVTIEQVKNLVMDAVGDTVPNIKYKNGANVPLSKYAEMLARTSRIETANGGIVARCKDINHDLVRYMALPNCCPRCQRFNNKVFSISGADTRFPYLYGEKGPFANGYNITHPNCRCEIMPFEEQLHSDEMEKIINESNRFENFTKSDKLFAEYNKQQAYNRQRNAELVEYFRLKNQLGTDFPYSRIGDFRRAKHANSEAYKAVKEKSKQSAFNGGFFEHIDIEQQLESKLMEYQEFLKNKNIEYAFIIQKNGDVHRFKGNNYSVISNEDMDMEGGINIHNHPPESDNSFSQEDFEYMQRHQGAQYILFTKSYTYTCSIKKDISNLNYTEIKNGAFSDILVGALKDSELKQEDVIFQYLKNEGYIDYAKYRN